MSNSSGAFGVEDSLTMCHHSSQARLPEDALDFKQMATTNMQAKKVACQAKTLSS